MAIRKKMGWNEKSIKAVGESIRKLKQRISSGPEWGRTGQAAPAETSRARWEELCAVGAYLKEHETK